MMRLLFLLTLISFSGCLEKPETRIFNQASRAFESKDYKKSSELFEKLVQTTKKYDHKIEATEKLISIYENQGEFVKKKKKLKFLVVNSNDRSQRLQAKQDIAEIEFSKLKNYTSAITHYSELIQLDFNKNKNQMMIVRSYYYLNNFAQSLYEIGRILKSTKDKNLLFESQLLQAHIYFAQKKYKEASGIYKSLIDQYPQLARNNFVLLNLAMSMEEGGEYLGAIKALQELQGFYHSPDFLTAKIRHIQKKKGRLPGAEGRLQR